MVAANVPAVNRVLLLGSKKIGADVLEALAAIAPGAVCATVTIDDRSDTRSQFEAISHIARAAGIPLLTADNRRHADDLIRTHRPDVCVVAAWYWIVSADLLASVPRGFIGIHNSLLPKYRGGAPLVWALINGDTEVGASIFSLRDGIDNGPVWLQARVNVGPDEYVDAVLERLERETLRVFKAGFPGILSGALTPREQNEADASYCAQRHPDDGEIDWSVPADTVFNFIRAQSSPYPGAFTLHEGQRLTIVRAARVPHRYDGTPGQITEADGQRIVVACGGASALRIDEVSVGAGPVPAGQVVRTIRTRFPRSPRLLQQAAATTVSVESWR